MKVQKIDNYNAKIAFDQADMTFPSWLVSTGDDPTGRSLARLQWIGVLDENYKITDDGITFVIMTPQSS